MNESFRQVFIERLKAVDSKRLVYVDESGINQCLYREYARAPRGQIITTKISGRKFKRTNIVAGICQGKWIAPLEYSSTTDSILFEYWFKECLLSEIKENSIIILDNATFHKKSVLPALAKAKHCEVWFLPPYSPDLNPIEKKWAWLKRTLRKTLCRYTTFDDAFCALFQVG